LKLDTKAMMAAVAAGDFTRALALYDKITPFPHILSAGCEAPCEGMCKLCTLGEGVAIRELESAAVCYGERPRKKGFLRKKTKKCAVFGVDLFSLFLAGELVKKMYPVTVYTQYADASAMIDACIPALSREVRQATVNTLAKMDIRFVWNADLADAYGQDYDLKCACFETAQKLHPGLCVDDAVMVAREFNLITGKTEGVLGAVFGAKKAALSADRMAQNLDPSNTRGEEGSVDTRLYTNLDGISPSVRIPVVDKDSAIAEAKRCIQCHCDFCNGILLFNSR
jgi:hypothetical protein